MINITKIAFDKGYRVTDDGRLVGSTGIFRKTDTCTKGYLSATIKLAKRATRRLYIHRLAAYQKFGEALFQDGVLVRHLNGNPFDNRAENIAIGTPMQNSVDIARNSMERDSQSLMACGG